MASNLKSGSSVPSLPYLIEVGHDLRTVTEHILGSRPTRKRSHKMSCYTLGTFQSKTNCSKEGLKGLVYLTEIHKQNTCTGNCHLK